jgi:hypothetical protein
MTEAGPLERIIERVLEDLSERPEETRLAIRSRSGVILDAMKATLESDIPILECWTVLADHYFQTLLEMLAYVSEIADQDRLLFEDGAAAALRIAPRVDEASAALVTGDGDRSMSATEQVEADFGIAKAGTR